MDVNLHDAPGRYLVESDKPNTPAYLVDLLAFDGQGQCTCHDWEFRVGSYLRAELPPLKQHCKHIAAARDVMLDDVLKRMNRLEHGGDGTDPTA